MAGELAVRGARTADYWFNGDLTSSISGAPDLIYNGSENHTTANIDGQVELVLHFLTRSGIPLLAGNLGISDVYTIMVLFEIGVDDWLNWLISKA